MIKVSVMYPNKPGARFDHAYYRDQHMPLVKARMGESCKFYTVDKGLAGLGPGDPATYIGGRCQERCRFFSLYFETLPAPSGGLVCLG